jgi:hypothetical protein
MTKKTLIFLIAFFALSASKAQVPPDSLLGTYVGKSWYRSGTTIWTITNDTTYVTLIDTSNCTLNMNNHSGTWSWGGATLTTRYYYCDTVIPPDYATVPSIYWYNLFYGGDSLTICDYNIPQAFPNQPYYYYFYGIRISNKITGINVLGNNSQISIYPNPVTVDLIIETPLKAIIDILNIEGQSIKTTIITDRKAIIDLNDLSSGVYFIKVKTDKGVVFKKFIKE